MPFDGATYTKHDTFSLDALIAWLEGQEPETTYNYEIVRDCLLTRYFAAHGVAKDPFGKDASSMSYGGVRLGGTDFEEVALGDGNAAWTYGAALTRARSLRNGGV